MDHVLPGKRHNAISPLRQLAIETPLKFGNLQGLSAAEAPMPAIATAEVCQSTQAMADGVLRQVEIVTERV